MIVVVCILIQFTDMNFNIGYGPSIEAVCAAAFGLVFLSYPIFEYFFLLKYYYLIREDDKVFKRKFKAMWAGLRTENTNFIYFNFYFLLRRLILAFVCVYFINHLCFQVIGLVLSVIFATIVHGFCMCFEDP